MSNKNQKTDDEWRALLSPSRYKVCREQGTEPPFTGEYVDCKESGTYRCGCCQAPLFSSATKFDSGTGWPSFFQPVSDDCLTEVKDTSFGTVRTEVVCRQCKAHLGHVFNDGPEPTGLRYCTNSIALDLERER